MVAGGNLKWFNIFGRRFSKFHRNVQGTFKTLLLGITSAEIKHKHISPDQNPGCYCGSPSMEFPDTDRSNVIPDVSVRKLCMRLRYKLVD